MNWFEALLLGILQGLTEFLPISSSGHLELGSYFLKTDNADNLLFTILHTCKRFLIFLIDIKENFRSSWFSIKLKILTQDY